MRNVDLRGIRRKYIEIFVHLHKMVPFMYKVMICFDMRALTYYGWCDPIIICWCVLRGKTTYSFDAHTDDLTHLM